MNNQNNNDISDDSGAPSSGPQANPLAHYDEDYEKTKVPQKIPAGKHQVYIAGVPKLTYTKAGDPRILLTLKVLAGEHKGRTCFASWMFGKKSLPYTKKDLLALGYTGKLSELISHLENFENMILDVTVIDKVGQDGRENQNTYINKRVMGATATPDPADSASNGAGASDMNDDIPF